MDRDTVQGENSMSVLSSFEEQGIACVQMISDLRAQTMVHAYLITGMGGVGKRTLARLAAQTLLCQNEKKPCGRCRACREVEEHLHPDIAYVRPGYDVNSNVERDVAKGIINVATIREVVRMVSLQAMEGAFRIVIIEQADKMNDGAQNALLKTLEEPPAGVVFFLLAESPGALLPTIFSRCRKVALHPWRAGTVERILKERGVSYLRIQQAVESAEGSIGKAIEYAEDDSFWERRREIMDAFFGAAGRSSAWISAEKWKDSKQEGNKLLDELEMLLHTLLHFRYHQTEADLVNEFPEPFRRMAAVGQPDDFLELNDAVDKARKMLASQVNWQAVLEQLLLTFSEVKQKWSR